MTGAGLSGDAIVAVVGAGTMGRGIAELAAVNGHRVLLFDANAAAVPTAIAQVRESIEQGIAKGKVERQVLAELRLESVASLEELAPCAIVIEAIIEDLGAKQSLFASLEAVVSQEAILATNTSSISPSAVASGLARPGRVVGMHFFNPVRAMKLIEVVEGQASDPSVVDAVIGLARAWGKFPVRCLARPGFIVNRMARPFYAEAWRLLGEHAADAATIDAALVQGGGFRMGPFALMDLIGHDTNESVTRSVWRLFGNDTRFEPSALQAEYVAAGWLGRKSGRGVVWPEQPTVAGTRLPGEVPADIRVGAGDPLAPLIARAATTILPVAAEAGVALGSGLRIERTRGATAAARERKLGAPVIVVDHSLAYEQLSGIAYAVSPGVSAEQHGAFVALLRSAEVVPLEVKDVPGLVVARTVSMIINLAYQALTEQLTTAEEIDTAMELGAGYPVGPVAWCRRWGAAEVVRVLSGVGEYYGDPRYRIAPSLRAAVAPAHESAQG